MRQMLARYLQKQIDQGLVRPINAEAAAQAFWGMFFTYGLARDVYADQVGGGMSADEIVSHFIDLFIHGIAQPE